MESKGRKVERYGVRDEESEKEPVRTPYDTISQEIERINLYYNTVAHHVWFYEDLRELNQWSDEYHPFHA